MIKENDKIQFSPLIYTVWIIYVFASLLVIYATFSHIKLEQLSNLIIPILILIALRIWPIKYYIRNNSYVFLSFSFPILLLYGIIPIIIAELYNLFFPNKEIKQKVLKLKLIFNAANGILMSYITYYFILYFNTYINQGRMYIFVIILSAIIFSVLLRIGVIVMIYLESKSLYNVYISNPFITNIANGIITFYLYQSLHILGLAFAVLYAIFFSKRSTYLEDLFEKKGELEEAENRLRMIFNSIDYGIIMLDMNRKIKMANPTALQFLQTLDQSPIGRNFDDFNFKYPDEIKQMLDWTYENQKNYHQKKIVVYVNKQRVYLDIHTYPNKIANGKIDGAILLYKNVTDEQLIRRQLIEADKLSHLGQIAAGKVHEIKNPLTTVRGYLQYLRQKVANGDSMDINHFDIALQELDRTNELISSLLILSKHSNFINSRLNIKHVLEEVIELFTHQMEMQNILFSKQIEKYLWVNGFENHLKQILINLLLNAIDAVQHQKNKAEIWIKAYSNDENVEIKIVDNGIGINSEDMVKLRLPFFTTKETGTGLGLSVTFKLIEEHHGTMDVNSKINEGSTFHIKLPKMTI